VAHHGDASAAGSGEPAEHGNQGGLAGAIGPEQAEELAFVDGEGHAVERAHGAARACIGLGDLIELDGGHGGAF
jgi:hypothetical protein